MQSLKFRPFVDPEKLHLRKIEFFIYSEKHWKLKGEKMGINLPPHAICMQSQKFVSFVDLEKLNCIDNSSEKLQFNTHIAVL